MNLSLNKRTSGIRYDGVALVDFEVRLLPLEDLYCPVPTVPAFVEELVSSIDRSGLLSPIVVVRGPREDILRQIAVPKGFPSDPVVNVVCGGTNRIAAIRSLGYSHADCVLLPNFQLATNIQKRQHNDYIQRKKNGTT